MQAHRSIAITPEVLVEAVNGVSGERPIKAVIFSAYPKGEAPKTVQTFPSYNNDGEVLVVTFVPEDAAEA